MTPTEQLRAILAQQRMDPDGPEIREMNAHRDHIQGLLQNAFGTQQLTIKYGGSRAKHTMVKAGYDLDIVAYFHHDGDAGTTTLESIYREVGESLQDHYLLQPNRSSIKLLSADPKRSGEALKIDVVPGRYTGPEKDDCFLFQAEGEKGRLKTNLRKHVEHIRDSGVVETLKLVKIFRIRQDIDVKQFALDLLVVDLLNGKASWPLDDQFRHVLTAILEAGEPIRIEDPANSNNDISGLLQGASWSDLCSSAARVLTEAQTSDWIRILGDSSDYAPSAPAIITSVAEAHDAPSKPWASKR